MYGPPGTGKSAYARWLADYLGMPLLLVSAADLMSKWVGESEKNIAALFRRAEREHAVLLIDEVDSFLQARHHARHSWEVTMVNEMLTKVEAFSDIFIASTNLMDQLDTAALRRFDLKVRFDYLWPAQALALLEGYQRSLALAGPSNVDVHVARRLGKLTPGDFAAVARQQRFRPFTSVTEFVHALETECALRNVRTPAIGFVQ